MHNSITRLEHFSLEIFLELFEYLSTRDCSRAFHNLNTKINSALNLSGLVIDLTNISRPTVDRFYADVVFSHQLRRVRKLKIGNELTTGLLETFFRQFNLHDFKQLRSLTLIKPSYMTLGSLALVIPYLKQLQHLSIDAHSYPNSFFRLVTSTSPTLTACYLPKLEIEEEISFQSTITHLTVTVEDITILLNLLAVFPRLEYLRVSLRLALYVDDSSLPKLPVLSCPRLLVLKLEILERSGIDFHEIEYFFQQTSLDQLRSLSYDCTTNSLDHTEVTRWNDLLTTHLSSIEKWNFFVQIPYNLYSYMNIEQIVHSLQTNLCYSYPLSLSINYSYYIIHTETYAKRYFDLSLKSSNSEQYVNCDPISGDSTTKYSKVDSLIVDTHSLSPCTILSQNIKHLHLQGHNDELTLSKCLKRCSPQLISLKVCGLPSDLPQMPHLRQLTIQQAMFKVKMVSNLSLLCPRLELLTIEIDCIDQFDELLDRLRDTSAFAELKFLRVFSRDVNRTWTSWLGEKNECSSRDPASYEAKNLFLFVWF